MKSPPKDYALVVQRGELRIVLGILHGIAGDERDILAAACARLELDPATTSLIAAPRPAPDAGEVVKLLRQYRAYLRIEDIDEEDVSGFLNVYARLRAADVELPPAEVAAIERFTRSLLLEEFADEGPTNTENDGERMPRQAKPSVFHHVMNMLPRPGPVLRACVG